MRNLRGKRALITGAASGIGRAIALRLAREGVDVCLVDVNQPLLTETQHEAEQMGVRVLAIPCDVRQPIEIERAAKTLLDFWGGLEILVNNVGVVHYGPTTAMTPELWDRLLSINLHAPIHFIRLLLPTLLLQPEAHIVNVASLYGLIATRKAAAYHATKYAVVGLSEALRAEYSPQGLGVTTVCPGFVATNLFSSGTTGVEEKEVPNPPRWLCTTPERVAEKTLRGIYRNRRLVLVTPFAYAMHYLKRFAPSLLDWAQHWGSTRARQKRLEKLQPDSSN